MYSRYRTWQGNPFEGFLRDADQVMEISILASTVPAIAAAQRADFTRNEEQRNFCADIFSRIERMAFAFDRLRELTAEDYRFEDAVDEKRDTTGTYTYSEAEVQAMARWHTETDLLTFYIYYELKSVIDMAEQWGISPQAASELEYVLRARDRFLAHPEFHRVAPHAYRGKSIPYNEGFTRCDVAGLQQWDPVTREQYFSALGLSSPVSREREAAEAAANETMIRSATRNERLTEEQVTRLKAFGVREPDLEKALREFAATLLPRVLEKIKEIHSQAVAKFGFEFGSSGPLMSARLGF